MIAAKTLLHNLLARGAFPRELPPPFTSKPFAEAVMVTSPLPGAFGEGRYISKPANYNLARAGTLHRLMGIPNPVSYFPLANFISNNWNTIFPDDGLGYSLSRPVLSEKDSGRAIDRKYSLGDRVVSRASVRSSSRFIVRADISRFYHSIYTHTIPWVLHTKTEAKRLTRPAELFGNMLDMLVRAGQDRQTLSIPVGPDTSLVVAELILSAIDKQMHDAGFNKWFRYMDDFEMGCEGHGEAENALATLQKSLHEFGLALNPSKTKIIELPEELDSSGVTNLRCFHLRTTVAGQNSDITNYFNQAFKTAKDHPQEQILKYAVARLSGDQIHKENWAFVQDIYMQCVGVEPGVLPMVLEQIIFYRDRHEYVIAKDGWGVVLSSVIKRHAPMGHSSEVAWALWAAIGIEAVLAEHVIRAASEMQDDCVALLLFDAIAKGCIDGELAPLETLRVLMTTAELKDSHWLLSYEANIKGWITGKDWVADDEAFAFLKSKNVSFYDSSCKSEASTIEKRREPATDFGYGVSTGP